MSLLVDPSGVLEPPIYRCKTRELNVVITSLSIGGAERIVLDWAARIYPAWKVHIVLIRDREEEWPVPEGVRVTRLHNTNIVAQLHNIGREFAASGNPTCLCHLLTNDWRHALKEGGAIPIPVLHNAKDGWPEGVSSLGDPPYVIAVSDACARDLRELGWKKPISVIRHLPFERNLDVAARKRYRAEWNIPSDATVIGMVGAVKSQKNYPLALAIVKRLLEKRDAYLVILGGPVNTKEGPTLWRELVMQVYAMGLRSRVAMPGYVPFAYRALPAFDIMLNTSHFEGFSIATAEALANGIPAVVSKVGGQGEVESDALTLVASDADIDTWVDALSREVGKKYSIPEWAKFPAYRLWTLASLVRPIASSAKTLFVTANLSSGGAQRSLVNLVLALRGHLDCEVAVAGDSTASYYYDALSNGGITVTRLAGMWSAFSYAESLIEKITTEGFGTVCFWNVHPQVKLLLAKSLSHTPARFIDVSPGGYGFRDMDDAKRFEKLIAYDADDYYGRLEKLVLKYNGDAPEVCREKTVVIENGVEMPKHKKTDYMLGESPRIVVCGRIAPSKFTLEIIEALRLLWRRFPSAELHFFGAAEPTDEAYAKEISAHVACFNEEQRSHIVFHGADFNAKDRLAEFDAFVVLGRHQGCPNALLEALAAGIPCVGNDDGGTSEQIIDGVTGLLIGQCDPFQLRDALRQLFLDQDLRERVGRAGRMHVERKFTMERMRDKYLALLSGKESAPARALAGPTEIHNDSFNRVEQLALAG